jgi:hypothetical protein
MMKRTLTKDLFTKVFIVGNQYAIFINAHLDYFVIVDSTMLIKYGKNVMSLGFHPIRNHGTGTFTYEKSHYVDSMTNGMNSVLSMDFIAKRMQARMSSLVRPLYS